MPKITPIPASTLRKVFEKAGFKCVRIEGDHFVYIKKGVWRPVVIPNWKEVPVFIIKNNLRTAGITREEYFSLLEEI
jgi:predicted RNA binding protein YcfA (HicA-like mRNA interferase family)